MAGKAKKASFGSNLFWALVTALFIISFAVVFVLYFRPLYYFDIGFLHLDTLSGKDAVTVRRTYDQLCNYLMLWNRGALNLTDFAMSEHGRVHFADCKAIFDVVQILCAATGALTLVSYFLHRNGGNSRYLIMAGILTIVLPVAVALLAFFRWDLLFTTFHTILFRNDYWLFDPAADPVIWILPDQFFFQCAVLIAAIILAGGIFCIVRALLRKRRVAAWQSRRRR